MPVVWLGFSSGRGAVVTTAHARAQQWHDTDHGSCDESLYSDCWCCCIICDPDWGHKDPHTGMARPNPFYAEATGRAGLPDDG